VVDLDTGEPLGSAEDWAELTPDEIDPVMEIWLTVQQGVVPDHPLDAEIKMRMLECSDVQTTLDASVAATNEDPAALFGRPASSLHAGQLLYFFALRRAHSDLYDAPDDGKSRKVSKKWLMDQLRPVARRSETTSQQRGKSRRSAGQARRKRWACSR
jgi:hypothetical protein